MSSLVLRQEVDRFYRAAVSGLAYLDARRAGSKRFGVDADARWDAFRGELSDWHRIDLLVRDASVHHPTAFAPRVVFALPALAKDEAHGPDWPGASPLIAKELLRLAGAGPAPFRSALEAVAAAWDLTPQAPTGDDTAGIGPATRLLLCGPGAVIAVATAFVDRPELDLADQAILAVADDDPGTRQLYGMALAFLDARRPARLVSTDVSTADIEALGVASLQRVIVSDDVAPAVRAHILGVGQALGARG
jgi:hypothetical protein